MVLKIQPNVLLRGVLGRNLFIVFASGIVLAFVVLTETWQKAEWIWTT